MARAGWFALDVDAFKKVEGSEFESLVCDLLEMEWHRRCGDPQRTIGPRGRSVADGKRDWGLRDGRVAGQSAVEFQQQYGFAPLIPDTDKPVVFSVKSGEWWSLAKRDAKPAARKKASTRGRTTKGAKKDSGAESTASPNHQVRALVAGGRVCLVINATAEPESRPIRRRDLAKLFHSWSELKKTPEDELLSRIEIIDATDLKAYLQATRPVGEAAERLAHALGVKLPPFDTLEEWREHEIKPERNWPRWSEDELRDAHRESLRAFLSQTATQRKEQRRAWIVGEPGIGKTRLIAEAASLTDPATQQAIYATSDFDRAKEWIDDDGFTRFPSLRLIVDDVDAQQADGLLRLFRKRAPAELNGALIVVTPSVQQGEQPEVLPRKLERLSASSVRALIQHAAPKLGDDAVRRIESLSEGVPWFAFLVARDAPTDDVSASFNMSRALRIAIQGREQDDGQFQLRARCMLMLWLCDGVLPSEVSDKVRLRQAVDIDEDKWRVVLATIEACQQRGIVRGRDGGSFYVSPALLLRELVTWFLGPKGPPGARVTMQKHAPREYERAIQALPQIGVGAEVIASAAAATLVEVSSLASLCDLSTAIADFDALPFIAQYAPRETVEALLPVLRRGSAVDERWRSEANRVRWALQVAWGYGARFALVEEALFALAATDGPGGWAEDLWSVSFFYAVGWGDAEADWCVDRLESLSRRHEPAQRRLVVTALRRLLDPTGATMPHVANRTESFTVSLSATARRCVELLYSLCGDEDATVQRDAVAALEKVFVAAARMRATSALDEGAARWGALLDEVQRANVISAVKRWFATGSDARARWLALLERKDIVGRVNDVLFDRGIDSWERPDDALIPIAQELVAASADVWDRARASLFEPGAAHVMKFSVVLGRVDSARCCLAGMLADVDAGRSPDPLSAYLKGRHDAGDDVDALTREWNAEPRLTARVVFVARKSPTNAECEWLEQLARRGHLSPHSLWALEMGRWENVSDERALAFVDACLAEDSPKRFSVAVFRLDRIAERSPSNEDALSLCARVMDLAVRGDRWVRSRAYVDPIAHVLLDAGRADVVAKALARMVVDDASGANTVAVNVMSECARRAPKSLWDAIASRFDRARGGVAADALLEQSFAAWAPADDVALWIGQDASRARWVARWCDVDGQSLHSLTNSLLDRWGADALVTQVVLNRITSGASRGSYVAALTTALETLRRWSSEAPALDAWCEQASKLLSSELSRARGAEQQPTGT